MGETLAAATEFGSQLFASAPAATEAALPAAGELAGTGMSMADIVGSGAGLFGGTTGLEGTLAAGGSGLTLADLAGGTAGLGALGTAADFMGTGGLSSVPGFGMNATGFGTDADVALRQARLTGLPGGLGGLQTLGAYGTLPTAPAFGGSFGGDLPANVANANASAVPPPMQATAPVTTPGITGSGTSAGIGASSVAAPSGVTGTIDPTAAMTTNLGGTGTSAATTATSGATPSITDMLKNAGSSAVKSLTGNPLGTAISLGGLGYNILSGQKESGNQKALSASAQKASADSDKMVASGEALQQYLTNGTLPPAYQQQVDDAIAAAKTTAISNAAAQGQPTDPVKNTALAATLAKIDASRAGMQSQVAAQLFSSGSSLVSAGQTAAGLSANLYESLVRNDTAQAANTGKAIANLAAALNGKSSANAGGITISTG